MPPDSSAVTWPELPTGSPPAPGDRLDIDISLALPHVHAQIDLGPAQVYRRARLRLHQCPDLLIQIHRRQRITLIGS